MVVGGGSLGQAGKLQKAVPDSLDSPMAKKADGFDDGFHAQAAGNSLHEEDVRSAGAGGRLYDSVINPDIGRVEA